MQWSDSRQAGATRPRRCPTMAIAAMPPPTTAQTGPSQAAAAPLSKLPSSLENPMNRKLIELTRPAERVGRDGLLQRHPDDHAHRVGGADQRQAEERERESSARGRSPIVARPNRPPPRAADSARAPPGRQPGRHERHEQRPHGGRRAEPAQPGRTHVQDVLGVHRKERHRAADQHGEQVERDRGEEDRGAPDEVEPGEDLSRAVRRRRGLRAAGRQREQDPDEDHLEAAPPPRRRARRSSWPRSGARPARGPPIDAISKVAAIQAFTRASAAGGASSGR